jgi:pimeloyl-ACP methyl ester carboxylesterase
MRSLRKYGSAPFAVAVIHGGPGAPGGMAPVARELSSVCGILEPLQTANSIEGQVRELEFVLREHGDLPTTLIGHSWGAWLSLIVAARFRSLVNKLILIGTGPLEEKYAKSVMKTRLGRLNEEERSRVRKLMDGLNDPGVKHENGILAQFGELISKTDTFNPLPEQRQERMSIRGDIFRRVWKEAEELRRKGNLLRLVRHIQCPVLAIHGDFDPHPAEGTERPLSQAIKNFRFILLKSCGHEPWNELNARDKFYDILKQELKQKGG